MYYLYLQTLHNALSYSEVINCYHVTRVSRYKMADGDVLFHRHTVIEFLVKKGIPAVKGYHILQRAYEAVAIGVSNVRRCVKHFKVENMSINYQPCSGRPQTASTERHTERVEKDRRVTVNEIAAELETGPR